MKLLYIPVRHLKVLEFAKKVMGTAPLEKTTRRKKRDLSSWIALKENRFFVLFQNKKVQVLFRILLTFFFVLLVNKSINITDIKLLFRKLELQAVACAVLLGAFGFYFQALRWRDILHSQRLPSKMGLALKTMFVGNLLGFLTPGRIGEFFRGVNLDPRKKSISIIAVVADRFTAVMMTLFFGIIAVIAQFLIYKKSVPVFFVVMLSCVVMIILVLFFVLKSHYPKLLRVTFLRPLLVKISSALPGLIRIHPGKIIIISMAVHAALILQTAVLFGMFGSDSFLKNCIVAAESYTFMLFLPFFIANIGLREYSFSLFLSDLAPSLNFEPHITAAALGASSIVLLINIIMPALIGLLWVVVTQGEKKGTILQKKKEKVPVLR